MKKTLVPRHERRRDVHFRSLVRFYFQARQRPGTVSDSVDTARVWANKLTLGLPTMGNAASSAHDARLAAGDGIEALYALPDVIHPPFSRFAREQTRNAGRAGPPREQKQKIEFRRLTRGRRGAAGRRRRAT